MEDKERFKEMRKLIKCKKCKMNRVNLYGLQDIIPSPYEDEYEALA